jgi:hypothetical protein
MEWYRGKLYVGTNRYYDCAEAAMLFLSLPFLFPYPPGDPYLQCPSASPGVSPTVPALVPTLAAEIWSLDPSSSVPLTQSNWTMRYSSALSVSMTIQGTSVVGPRDLGFRGMSVYDDGTASDPSLYVSGVGLKSLGGPDVPPPSLLRSTDGVSFQAVPSDPGTTLGDINQFGSSMRGQLTYNGDFYILIGGIYGSGRVFVSAHPDQGDNSFQQFTPTDMQVFEMQTFNGHLYLGVESNQGYLVDELIDSACPTLPCPDTAFKLVVPAGGGLPHPNSFGITSMHVYTDSLGSAHLYIGSDGSFGNVPAELIRVNPDDSWDLIVGKARTVGGRQFNPLSGQTAGFGWKYNTEIWRMEDYRGVLYVGTYDRSTLVADVHTWPQSLMSHVGFDLWASADGEHFSSVTTNGFGDRFSDGARSLQATPYGLFVGSATRAAGLHVWQAVGPQG